MYELDGHGRRENRLRVQPERGGGLDGDKGADTFPAASGIVHGLDEAMSRAGWLRQECPYALGEHGAGGGELCRCVGRDRAFGRLSHLSLLQYGAVAGFRNMVRRRLRCQ